MGRMTLGMLVTGALLIVAAARADEAGSKTELARLNQVTGTDPRLGALNNVLEDKAKAKELLKYALPLARQEKTDALTYNGAFLLGLAAAELKDMPAAEAFLRVCMKQAAMMQSVQKLKEAYGGLIEMYYAEKRYEDADRVCRDLLALKTDDNTPRIVYQAMDNNTGEYDFHESDKFDSTRRLRMGVQQKLVLALAKQGKYEQALQLVDRLLKQQDHWLLRHLRAQVLHEAGQLDKAVAIYEDVINRVAKDSDLDASEREDFASRYRYELSNLYVDLNKIDKASEALEQLIKRKPQVAGFYNDLGYIWADHDMKLDEAEKLVRKALDLDRERRKKDPEFDPKTDHDNGAYLDSLGWVFYKQKKLPEAKEMLQKAVEDKGSQHIEIYDHLGDVLMAMGERDAALAAWRKGLEVVGEGRREQERRAAVERKLDKNK